MPLKKYCSFVTSSKLSVSMQKHQLVRIQPHSDKHYSFVCRWCSSYCTIKKTKFWGIREAPLLERIFQRIANPGMWF